MSMPPRPPGQPRANPGMGVRPLGGAPRPMRPPLAQSAQAKGEPQGPYKEYRLIKGPNDRPYFIMRFGNKVPDMKNLPADAVLAREEKEKPPEEEPKEQLPTKGAGSIYKDEKKWGKVKRRFNPRKEAEMPFVLDLGEGEEGKRNLYHATKEGGQIGQYSVFTMHKDAIEVIPTRGWYTFKPDITYRTLTLEEAEEQMKKFGQAGQRWMMKLQEKKAKREGGDGDEKGDYSLPNRMKSFGRPAPKMKDSDDDLSDNETKRLRRTRKMDAGIRDEEEEAPEFEGTFSDDDESAVPKEIHDEEEKEPVIEPDSESSEEEGEDGKDQDPGNLTEAGRQLKKLLKAKTKKEEEDEEKEIEGDAASGDDDDDDMVDAVADTPQERPNNKRTAPDSAVQASKKRRKEDEGGSQPAGSADNMEEIICRTIAQHPGSTAKELGARLKKTHPELWKNKVAVMTMVGVVATMVTVKKVLTLKPEYKQKYNL